jgi:hypothetical protein
MTNPVKFKVISVLGSNLLEPTFDLINMLQRIDPTTPNKMQSSVVEHTYSAAIILLCATSIESCIRRIQYLHKDRTWNLFEYAEAAFSDYDHLDHLNELLAVRDSIAHNHLWLSTVLFTPPDGFSRLRTKRVPGSGDKRLNAVLNSRTRRTKILRLNLRPTSLSRLDVSIILKVASDFLFYLETKDPAHAPIVTGRYYLLGSQHYKLPDAVAEVGKKWRTAYPRRRARTPNKRQTGARTLDRQR